MRFIKGTPAVAAGAIAERLHSELEAGKQVLWLTSGGSNTELEVEIMKQLQPATGDKLAGLTILPMDERYGPSGHADSNTAQLRTAGFESGTATWIDVLSHGLPLAETAEFYSDTAARALAAADIVIGQFGMGDDGHIAGIKPHSPATQDDPATVIGYKWSDYTRLTLSSDALKQVDVAYLPAFGAAKGQALKRLQDNTEPFEAFPAALLYKLPEVFVYNDSITSEGND